MKDSIAMFARMDAQDFALGFCHPAQARLLVKQELASWQDGKLLLILRPSYMSLIDANSLSCWRGPLDDSNQMSDGEMKRRRAWFKDMLPKVAIATAESNSKDSRITYTQEELQKIENSAATYMEAAGCHPDQEITEEEAAFFFEERPLKTDLKDLQALWNRDTDEDAKFFKNSATSNNLLDVLKLLVTRYSATGGTPEALQNLWNDDSNPGEMETEEEKSCSEFSERISINPLENVWDSSPDVSSAFEMKETLPRLLANLTKADLDPQVMVTLPREFKLGLRKVDLTWGQSPIMDKNFQLAETILADPILCQEVPRFVRTQEPPYRAVVSDPEK